MAKRTKPEEGTYSRADFRELQRKADAAEHQLTLRTVRAAKQAKGRPIATTMNSKQLREYEQLKKRAKKLEELAELARHEKGVKELAQRVVSPENARLARQHFKTATSQVARLFSRSKAGGNAKAGGAKARSH